MSLEDQIKKLDFTKVTRDTDEVRTFISLQSPYYGKVEITCGRIDLFPGEGRSPYGRLTAHADYGVTDFEHDSAYIFQLPIVSEKVEFIRNGMVYVQGLLLGRDVDDLRLSLDTNYDPTKLEGAYRCGADKKYCSYGETHWIVPEGHYAGPKMKTQELYRQLVGSKIELRMIPATKHNE